MKSKWRVEAQNIAGGTFFLIYRLKDLCAKDCRENRETRGTWDTEEEAQRIVDKLNSKEGWKE